MWGGGAAFVPPRETTLRGGPPARRAGPLTPAVTLPVPVDQEHAFSLVSVASSGTGPDLGARALQAQLTNSTTLTIQRADRGSPDPIEDIAWQVVDLKDGSRVRSGSTNFAAGVGTGSATIDPVDPTRASAFASVQYGGGAAMGRTTYVADDIPGTATAT